MTFIPEKVKIFLEVFESSKNKIRNFEGCSHLELLRDVSDERIFFTHSKWESEKNLENYRNSELFKSTWEKTKILFADKPQAWSVKQVG